MTPKLQQTLYDKYPKLFVQKDWGMASSCMCWGCDTGDGWYKILDEVCQKLMELGGDIQFVQIKEKFGLLRVYIDGWSKEAQAIVDAAEKESGKICEQCGEPGELQRGGWLYTACPAHTRGNG